MGATGFELVAIPGLSFRGFITGPKTEEFLRFQYSGGFEGLVRFSNFQLL